MQLNSRYSELSAAQRGSCPAQTAAIKTKDTQTPLHAQGSQTGMSCTMSLCRAALWAGEEQSPGDSQDLVRQRVRPARLHSPRDHALPCHSSSSAHKTPAQGGFKRWQELFGGPSFALYSNSGHIWLLPSHWEAFCCLLKSRVLLFPQFLNLFLFMSMPLWQGHLKNELYFASWQGRGSGGSRKTDG